MSNAETAVAYLEAVVRKDYEQSARYVDAAYVWIDRALGFVTDTPEKMQAAMDDANAWSDETMEIERVMETSDGHVVVQAKSTRTHTGTWRSIPPTGKRASHSWVVIMTFTDEGRIAVEDDYHDYLSIMEQLGVVSIG